jgi:hypothetical protein
MAKTTKAGGGTIRDTEVVIIIKDLDATEEQLDKLEELGQKLVPEFLGMIKAQGKQFEVTSAFRHQHPRR